MRFLTLQSLLQPRFQGSINAAKTFIVYSNSHVLWRFSISSSNDQRLKNIFASLLTILLLIHIAKNSLISQLSFSSGNGSSQRSAVALSHQAANVSRSESIAESPGEFASSSFSSSRCINIDGIIGVQINSWPASKVEWFHINLRADDVWSWHQFVPARFFFCVRENW